MTIQPVADELSFTKMSEQGATQFNDILVKLNSSSLLTTPTGGGGGGGGETPPQALQLSPQNFSQLNLSETLALRQ